LALKINYPRPRRRLLRRETPQKSV